jgi:dihydrofolate synthase/folylpolyglutamate synthase
MPVRGYQEALDYLYSFVDYSVKRKYRYSAEIFDLARVRDLLAAMGNPQELFPSVHIAGTKGKGSVSALIAACLREQGYKTALYTSPHLIQFTERIQIDGQEIPKEQVVALVDRLEAVMGEDSNLTVYELITAMAFQYFADASVDCAVVEVGMGGRLDATNVLNPLVSVITSLSYDHMHLLGASLSDIAREKGGIIKPNVPLVVAPQQFEAERVIEEIAREREAPLIKVGVDWHYAPGSHELDRQSLYIWSAKEQPLMDAYVDSAGGEEWAPPRFDIPLLGHHQVVNAAVAYAALSEMAKAGLPISAQSIKQGFRRVEWPGRFQILSEKPAVVIDSAHNRDSALKLRIALDDYFPGRMVLLIFGASEDKDLAGMMTELAPRVSRLIITQASHPRAADPNQLANLARGFGLKVEVVTPVTAALRRALEMQDPDEVVLAAGSLFIAGEVLSAWKEPSHIG